MAAVNVVDFVRGTYDTAVITASGAKTAGNVVQVGTGIPAICHHDIADGENGTVAVFGGIYKGIGDGVIAAGTRIYWDVSEGKLSATATSNPHAGFAVSACSGDDAAFDFHHSPDGSVGS